MTTAFQASTRRQPRARSGLAVVLGSVLAVAPAQTAPSAPVDREAVTRLLAELDADFNARNADAVLERFEPDDPELLAVLAHRLRFLFSSTVAMRRRSELVEPLHTIGPRTVALVRSVTALGKPPKQATTEYRYLAVKAAGDRAVPVLAVEVFQELRDQVRNGRFTCGACNYSIGGPAGWLAVPLLPDRADAMEAVSFYRLGSDLSLDVSVYVDPRECSAAVRLQALLAEIRSLVPDVEVLQQGDWLPAGLADAAPPHFSGRRADLRLPSGTRNILHLLALGRLRYLLVLEGRDESIQGHRADIEALLRSFRIEDPQRSPAELADRPVDAHHGGAVDGRSYENDKRRVKFDAPPGWRGERRGSGQLFQVVFTCPAGGGKLWLSGHAPPISLRSWTAEMADQFLGNCLQAGGLSIVEDGPWCAGGEGGLRTRTLRAAPAPESARDCRVRARLFRLGLADDLLVVVQGFTEDPANERLLQQAFATLRRR